MNIPKDVYEYISQFADDRTILTMLTANKELAKNDKLFERVLLRKYPLLTKFKKENETWKNLYIRMAYYISKLEEEFGIPYIALENYNPEEFYKIIKDKIDRKHMRKKDVYNVFMAKAARAGNIKVVKLMLEKGANDFTTPMVEAALYGHIDIVKLMLEKKDTAFAVNWALQNAALGGHIEIVKLLLEKGGNINEILEDWTDERKDRPLLVDVKRLVETVVPLVDRNTLNFQYAIENAIEYGDYEVAEYLEQFL